MCASFDENDLCMYTCLLAVASFVSIPEVDSRRALFIWRSERAREKRRAKGDVVWGVQSTFLSRDPRSSRPPDPRSAARGGTRQSSTTTNVTLVNDDDDDWTKEMRLDKVLLF